MLSILSNPFCHRPEIEAFKYESPFEDDSIRLIRFVRPKWYTFRSRTPQLIIERHRRNRLPKYVALSYTWDPPHDGVPNEKASICINGHPFTVSRNLIDALSCLYVIWSFRDDVQHLWIDAICINQEDKIERAAQVAIMDQIYKDASQTIIWLGRADRETRQAMQMCKAALKIPPEELRPYSQQYPNRMPPPDSFWNKHGLPGPDDQEKWKPLLQVFENRWFSRSWVIQEVLLSKELVVMQGYNLMSWDQLGYAALVGRTARLGQLRSQSRLFRYIAGDNDLTDAESTVTHDPFSRAFRFWLNRDRYLEAIQTQHAQDDTPLLAEVRRLTGGTQIKAISWLVYFSLMNRWADATDARDKVFCYRGIVNTLMATREGTGPTVLRSVYVHAATPWETYAHAIKLLVRETDSLDVLIAINDPLALRHPSLPSWVPDLSIPLELSPMWSITRQFRANGDTRRCGSSIGEGYSIRIDGSRLYAKGTVVGVVETLSVSQSDLLGPNWYRWTRHLLGLDIVYPFTEESRVEAFWRTILMKSAAPPGSDETPTAQRFRAYVLQSLTRYILGPDPNDKQAYHDYLDGISHVNKLAEADFSNTMPSIRSQAALASQITGLSEEAVAALTPEELRVAFMPCIEETWNFLMEMYGKMTNRRIALSDRGHIANVPLWTEVGDRIVILDSCSCPLVLRQHYDGSLYSTLVGSAYVHGIMDGESVGDDTHWEELCIK